MQVLSRHCAGHLLVAHEREGARTLVAGDACPAPLMQVGFDLAKRLHARQSPREPVRPICRQADRLPLRHEPTGGADDRLDVGRVHVLAPSDDHVALAIDEMDEAVSVAVRHVADRTIVAAERLARFFRQLPIAVKNVRIAGVKLADFAIRNFVAIRIEKLDRSRTYDSRPTEPSLSNCSCGWSMVAQPVSVEP